MKLNIYANQRDIEKTYEADEYDLMFGTVEDVLDVLDGLTGKDATNEDFIRVINENRTKLNELLLDIFPDLQPEELRRIKVKELIPLFIDLFSFVQESLTSSQAKN